MASAQEDPRRFLNVTQWRLASTQSATGNAEDGGAFATWDQSGNFQAQLAPGSAPGIHPQDASWLAEESAAGAISVNNVYTSFVVFTTRDDGFLGGKPQVTMDLTAQTYTVHFPVSFKTVIPEFSIPGNGWWVPGGSITNALPPSGMRLSGEMSWPILAAAQANAAPIAMGFSGAATFSGDLTVTWTLEPVVEEVELVVEPEDYANWIPAANLEDPEKFGNLLFLTATLRSPGGGAPAHKATRIRFELTEVSREPGLCMNFPITSPSTDRDLKFEAEINIPIEPPIDIKSEVLGEVVDPVGTGTGTGTLETAHALISAFDFGAWGTLKVTAQVNGNEIVGYWKDDPRKVRGLIRLPRREPDSHVADAWKERMSVSNLADQDDAENVPIGDEHRGDGYSLYEEYRGFSENRVHRRLLPKQKDLFILDLIGDGETKQGIRKFASSSGLKVWHELVKDEMTELNLMNINHGGQVTHLHDQAGLRLVQGRTSLGYSIAEVDDGQQANSTPGAHTEIRLDPETAPVADPAIGGFLRYQASYASVPHELGHGCSVWHHGDADPGNTALASVIHIPGGIKATLNGLPVIVLREDFSPLNRSRRGTVFVAVPQGQHSGDQDCIMRYQVANLYTHLEKSPSTNSVTQEVTQLLVFYRPDDEDPNTRSHLCISPNGTGVNTPKPGTPWPRYGDAAIASRRGNCKGQVCVNDLYKDDPKHRRD